MPIFFGFGFGLGPFLPPATDDELLRFRGRAWFAVQARLTVGALVRDMTAEGAPPAAIRARLLADLRELSANQPDCECGLCRETRASATRQAIDLAIPPGPDDYPQEPRRR